ncbi:MAG: S9 family peptidase [Hyphomonadaceae bacterium]
MWLAPSDRRGAPTQEAEAQEAEAAPSGPPPASVFAKASDIQMTALSPTGRYLASVLFADKDSYFVYYDLENPGARTVRKMAGMLVHSMVWVSDDRMVFSAGSSSYGFVMRGGALYFRGIPRFYSVSRTGEDVIDLFKDDTRIQRKNLFFGVEPVAIPGDGEHILLPAMISDDVDLLKVDVRTGKWVEAADGGPYTLAWLIDINGQPSMRLDTNFRGTVLRVLAPRPQGNGKVRWKEVARWRRDRESGQAPDFTPIGPGPEPGQFYVLGRPPGQDRIGVHLYDANAEAYIKEVFVHPEVDVSHAFVNASNGAYAGASYWLDHREIQLVDAGLQAHIDGLREFYGEQANISIVDRSEDGRVWLLFVRSPQNEGAFHVYDTRAAFSQEIARVNPELDRWSLGSLRAMTYTARDGMKLHGYLTLPPGLAEGEKPPLVVYPHGGPEARDVADFDPVVQFLATHGYAVFQPNFRGSSGYGLAYVKAGHRQFGRAMQTDIDDGVAWIAEQGLADVSRTCIVGASYGGYAALMGAVTRPDLYRCAASAMGISDLRRQILWDRKEEGSDSEAYHYWVEQLGDPGKDRAEMEANSPLTYADKISVPILLIHGDKDDNVPIEQSEFIYEALQSAGKQVRFVRMPDAGHGFDSEDLETYLKELEAFLGATLGGAQPASAGAQ